MERAVPHFQAYADKMHNPAEGGFTVQPKTGKEPKAGFMVSLSGSERQLPAGKASGSDLGAFTEEHKDWMSHSAHFLGGWSQPDADYVDRSVRHTSRKAGAQAMHVHNQIAMRALRKGVDVQNPTYDPKGRSLSMRTELLRGAMSGQHHVV